MADKPKETISSELQLAQAENYFKDEELLLSPPLMRAAYSDRMAWIMACMSQMAYDGFERDPQILELLKVKLKGGGFNLLAAFNSPGTDTQAILVSNDSFAVLAFRGTEVTKRVDMLNDADAFRVSTIEGKVHKGFMSAYESVSADISNHLSAVKNLPLYITGHSLGAALATVAAQNIENDYRFKNQIAACYTFGSPRVGNAEYDVSFKSPIYRVVNTTDIVTVVPLLAMGYIHIGDVRFLGRDPQETIRRVPILLRTILFIAAMFRLFGPWVGDHAITEYKRKLQLVAERRNPKVQGITRR